MPGFASSISNSNEVVFAKNADFTLSADPSSQNGLITNGQLWIGHTDANIDAQHVYVGNLTSPGGTLSIGYSSPNITLDLAATADLHVARFIVASSTSGTGANYTTIASAITAAAATGINSTVFIQPGTYTENLTLPANINLCAFTCDANTPNVTIAGTITCTTAGTRSISGIFLQTNGAALLAVTGSAATLVNLNNCYLNCLNATGITYSVSNSSSTININNCTGNLGATGIGLFTHTSTGAINIFYSKFTNFGNSVTASTCSSGVINIEYSTLSSPITTSGTSAFTWDHIAIDCNSINTTAATLGGSGLHTCRYSRFNSGTASAVSISSSTPIFASCIIGSSNTNAVTGGGTIVYSDMMFEGSSTTINTTTQTNSGTLVGSRNKTPSAGFLGERISSFGNAVAAGATTTIKTITSISLTPGVWDITAIGTSNDASFNTTLFQVGISLTTNTIEGFTGDQNTINMASGLIAFMTATVPAFRVVISATTTYYLVSRVDYAVGSPTVSARLSAVRVG